MKYTRLQNQIFNEDGTLFEKLSSISQAKHRSRMLQKAGNKVTVDHSKDPKPVALNFGRKNPRYQYVSRAEERRFAAERARRQREETAKAKASLGLSKAQLEKVS